MIEHDYCHTCQAKSEIAKCQLGPVCHAVSRPSPSPVQFSPSSVQSPSSPCPANSDRVSENKQKQRLVIIFALIDGPKNEMKTIRWQLSAVSRKKCLIFYFPGKTLGRKKQREICSKNSCQTLQWKSTKIVSERGGKKEGEKCGKAEENRVKLSEKGSCRV